jgi:hypothetical protein
MRFSNYSAKTDIWLIFWLACLTKAMGQGCPFDIVMRFSVFGCHDLRTARDTAHGVNLFLAQFCHIPICNMWERGKM